MKKLIIILVVGCMGVFLTSCFPLFYGDSNYPNGRRYYPNERHQGRRNYQRHDRDYSYIGNSNQERQYESKDLN